MAIQVLELPDTGYHFLPSGIPGCSLPQLSVHSMPNAPRASVRNCNDAHDRTLQEAQTQTHRNTRMIASTFNRPWIDLQSTLDRP